MITYNDILSRMQDKFKDLSGYSADEASDIGIRLKVLAGEIYSSYTNLEFIKTQMFPQTATGTYLDMHAMQRGLQRIGATKSSGTLTFSRAENILYDVTIPKGTVCATAQINGVRYVTLEDAYIASGQSSVSVPAESETAGSIANALKSAITVMVTPPAGISAVTNESAFVGGSDSESDDDLRQRLLYSYKNISNGSNCAFYRDIALGFDDVYSVSVINRPNGSGTVDIYVANNGAVLESNKMSEIQSKINSLKEINVNAQVKAPALVSVSITLNIVVKDGYDSNTVKANCEANIANYFSTLKIGQDVFLADIANVVYNTEGIINYQFTNFTDRSISDVQLATLGTTTITVGGVDI